MTDETKDEQTTTTTPPPAGNGASDGGQSDQDASKAVQDRIKRAKQKTTETILKELGFENLDAAKTAFAEVRQVREGQLTEAQKLQKQVDKLTADLAAATTRATSVEQLRRNDLVDAAIKGEAKDGPSKAEHVEDVITFIRQSGTELTDLIDDEGKVDMKEVKKLVDNVRKERPSWFASGGPGSPSNRNGKALNPEEQVKKALQGKKLFNL